MNRTYRWLARLLLAGSMALAACANPALPPTTAGSGSIAVATMAPLGSFEHEIAPQYTRAEVVALRAARAVRTGTLDQGTAGQILRHLSAARSDLNAAVALEARTRDREAARRRAQPAVQSIEQASALLRGQ